MSRNWFNRRLTCVGRPQSPHRLDHFHQDGLGVAVNHVAIILVEQRVHDAGITFALVRGSRAKANVEMVEEEEKDPLA